MANWEQAIQIEHRVAQIITQQEINGWKFDVEGAHNKIQFLENECERIYKEVRPLLKPEVVHAKKPVTAPFKRNGDHIKRVSDVFGLSVSTVSGPFNFVDFIEPDLSKRKKLMTQLSHHGWKPLEYTEKGNPKLTEESMECLGGLGKEIARWYILQHRASQIRGWIANVRPDGRITAAADPCGTNTGRMRHRIIVNVPKASKKVVFGKEMRELFTVPEGKVLVGHDASGLEARMMAHYLNDPEMTEVIISGKAEEGTDFHTRIWNPIRDFCESRDNAKNIEYALIYGGQDPKIGSMADYNPYNWSIPKLGSEIRARIMKDLPALGDLVKRVQNAAERGYLIGLDGRKVYVRGIHAALNLLFQSAGAIVMKKSMILLDDWVKEESLDVKKVGDFHDEAQAEVSVEHAELYAKLAVQSIIESGKHFNLRCPLDGEAKIGRNWAETH